MAFSVSRWYAIIDVLKPLLCAGLRASVTARHSATRADHENAKRNKYSDHFHGTNTQRAASGQSLPAMIGPIGHVKRWPEIMERTHSLRLFVLNRDADKHVAINDCPRSGISEPGWADLLMATCGRDLAIRLELSQNPLSACHSRRPR